MALYKIIRRKETGADNYEVVCFVLAIVFCSLTETTDDGTAQNGPFKALGNT